MPPGRRGRPLGSSNGSKSRPTPQSTLAFGGRSNKITKPSVPAPSSKKASKPNERQTKDISQVIEDETPAAQEDEVKDEVVEEDQSLAEGRETAFAIREREVGKETEAADPAEEKARKVSDAAVKRYWRAKEEERKAPRGILPCLLFSFLSHHLPSRRLHLFGRNELTQTGQCTSNNSPSTKRSSAISTCRRSTARAWASRG